MSGLAFDILREANQRRLPEFAAAFPDANLDDWKPNDWATATTGELGEACNLLKKLRRGQPIPREEIAREIADAQIYLDFLAWSLDIDLGEATIDTFNAKSDELGLKTHIFRAGEGSRFAGYNGQFQGDTTIRFGRL